MGMNLPDKDTYFIDYLKTERGGRGTKDDSSSFELPLNKYSKRKRLSRGRC